MFKSKSFANQANRLKKKIVVFMQPCFSPDSVPQFRLDESSDLMTFEPRLKAFYEFGIDGWYSHE